MQRKRILFITPPYHCGVVEVAGRWLPLTFVYLAGAAREAGFEPIIYDAMTKGVGFKEIEQKIIEVNPSYVATTAITSTFPDALEILKIAKEINNEIITIIGGVHPTFMYKDVLKNGCVDYVVRGEGEETLRELLICLDLDKDPEDIKGIAYRKAHKIIVTNDRPFIRDLDSLPTAWDLIEWRDYRYFVIPNSRLGAVSTSRGCSHNCTFCSQQKFWHQTWRGRDPEKVVAEIEYLHKKYGVNVFLFPDEYPTQDRSRWEKLLDLLIEKGMDIYLLMETRAADILRDRDILWKYRKAGIVHIYIGVEATDQETLDLIKKDVQVETGIEAIKLIHENGMITETSFILGFPHETPETIQRTLALSKIYNPDFAHYLALAPWPYADMYKELKPYIVEKDYRKYNLIDPVIKPEHMTIQEIDKAIINCYQSFYMGKLTEIMSMTDAFKKDYLIRSMKLMMSSSFIVEKLGNIGTIPPQVDKLIRKIGQVAETDRKTQLDEDVSAVTKSIIINAPIEKVFSFVANPYLWPKYITGLKEITNISTDKITKGTTFGWTYSIRGVNISGQGIVAEYEENKKLTLQMHSLLPMRETILFSGDAEKTILTIDVGYKKAGKILSFLFNIARRTLNIVETTAILEKIKILCEQNNIDKEDNKIYIHSGSNK